MLIKIVEDTPYKVSGITSLKVYLNTDKSKDESQQFYEIVRIVKEELGFVYYKKQYFFEGPVTQLSNLLDRLTFLGDIELIIKNNENVCLKSYKPILEYKTPPFKHQLEGIQFGLNHDKWLLLDGMGLGKSYQIINLARELKEQKGLQHCLVICGFNTLKSNWKSEIQTHSDETVRVLGEKISKRGKVTYARIPERAKELLEPINEFFIVTNIETFRSESVVNAFNKSKNQIDMIVVDEIHKCKNSQSTQGSNLLKLDSKYKVAATGTLLLNNPLDCFVPLKWTDNDKSTLTNFKNLYCEFGGFGGHQVVGFKNLDILKDEIENCCLRRQKDLLDLPEKTVINEIVEMSDEESNFYETIEDSVKSEAESQAAKERTDKINLNTNTVLSLVTRLRQASVLPQILTSEEIKSSKIERCIDLVEQLVENNEKVVVMSTFKQPVDVLSKELEKYKPLVCTGNTKDEQVDKYKKMFQEDDEHKIMLATWQKMGTGHTLTRASYMIFLDTPWTSAVFEQACDRIYRIGTKRPVFIYNLIAKDTIDERVAYLLKRKKAISDFVIDDDMTENTLQALRQYISDL